MSITSNIRVVSVKIDSGVLRIYKQEGAPDFLITGLNSPNTLPHPRGAAQISEGAGTNPAPSSTEFTVTMRGEDYPHREEGERMAFPPGSMCRP